VLLRGGEVSEVVRRQLLHAVDLAHVRRGDAAARLDADVAVAAGAADGFDRLAVEGDVVQPCALATADVERSVLRQAILAGELQDHGSSGATAAGRRGPLRRHGELGSVASAAPDHAVRADEHRAADAHVEDPATAGPAAARVPRDVVPLDLVARHVDRLGAATAAARAA